MITLRRRRDPVAHRVNVEGTRNVVGACRTSNVRRLVYFSSIHAYSSHPRHEPIDESRPLCVNDDTLPYDRSKAAAEEVVRNAVEAGLDAVILNPTGVLGPHDYEPSAMGRVLLDLRAGRFPVLVRGGFNWVDARDVAEAAVRVGNTAEPGARYILGGTYATMGDIAGIIAGLTGRPAPTLTAPLWLAACGVPFTLTRARLTNSKPHMTRASLRALQHHQLVSHEKAARELDYAPRPLETTIADTLAWFDARAGG
jgi:dihydroflavonol-4-reductase